MRFSKFETGITSPKAPETGDGFAYCMTISCNESTGLLFCMLESFVLSRFRAVLFEDMPAARVFGNISSSLSLLLSSIVKQKCERLFIHSSYTTSLSAARIQVFVPISSNANCLSREGFNKALDSNKAPFGGVPDGWGLLA